MVAGPVEMLVVGGAERADRRQHRVVREDPLGEVAVQPDPFVFGPGQRAGLRQQARLDADPTDVVDQRCAGHQVDVVR